MLLEKIKRHRGQRLSKEQPAVATFLAEAISNYSEDSFWYETQKQQRPGFDEVWEQIHNPFASRLKKAVQIPPMPRLN